jgi:hypothetical protein
MQHRTCKENGEMIMRRVGIGMIFLLLAVLPVDAKEVFIPTGTVIEGETVFGTYAAEPENNANNPYPFLAIRAEKNPVGVGGEEIPLKDCIFLGDVVSDLKLNRAFFRATRIKCSNAKEPNGSALRGYAIDQKDNKLGIRGVRVETTSSPKYVEVPPHEKVYLIIVDGVSITTK